MSVRLGVNVAKNFDLSKISLDLSQEINEGANIVKADIQKHIKEEKRIDNEQKQAPLSEVTIARKLSKKGKPAENSEKILREYDNLIYNQRIEKATPENQRAVIDIGPERSGIAPYLQDGTPKMPERPFFGISDNAESKILRNVERSIDRKLRRL